MPCASSHRQAAEAPGQVQTNPLSAHPQARSGKGCFRQHCWREGECDPDLGKVLAARRLLDQRQAEA